MMKIVEKVVKKGTRRHRENEKLANFGKKLSFSHVTIDPSKKYKKHCFLAFFETF